MKKRKVIIIILLIVIILIVSIIFHNTNPVIEVNLKNNLTTSFNSSVRVSDFINSINGQIINDYYIDTSNLGVKKVSFEYINYQKKKVSYNYQINIVDNTPPVVWLGNSYNILTTYEGNLVDDIMCGDDYDDNPNCQIKGEYNSKQPGVYNLTFEATDSSGNKTIQDFNLYVNKPVNENNSSGTELHTNFKDVVKNYKTKNTKIGIDISHWQENIDYKKVADAGVEFVFIKVGGRKGIDGNFTIDKKFKENIEGFNKVGIPVGVYIYSYAKTASDAKKEALWVLKQINNYKVDLPIVYDWENWSFYNEFKLSFYHLTNNAQIFLDTINDNGYEAALYSSKNYLEKIWLNVDNDIWLAHYTDKTNYLGKYKYWQLCDNGVVNGINKDVDIDIMYK